ncbi:hypothetical protein MRBLBA3_000254 [Bacillus sp. LBA3-1-1.1]|uniref:hypothetical protein n=1 Tax=Bacillus TaxID=1386 RepID=UPI00343E6959
MKGLCHSAGIQPRQLYRAWNGECSYRSQQSVALTLIANLPYEVSDELISKANDLLDGIADSLLEIFKEDTENYKEDGEIYE